MVAAIKMGDLIKRLRNTLIETFARFRPQSSPATGPRKGKLPLGLLRQHWPLLLAGFSAVGAFLLTQSYAETRVLQERERLLPKGGLIEVLVAARDLGSGDIANPQTVAVRRMPQDWSLPGAITPLDFDAINQKRLIRPVKAGHPITVEHLRQGPAQLNGVRLEAGYRAISLSVDEVSSVGGLIQPGDRIDLWGSAPPQAPNSEGTIASLTAERAIFTPRARLIAENLRVLATGARTERLSDPTPEHRSPNSGSPFSTITLAVPVSLANLVLAGQLQGRLGIALRAAGDIPRSTAMDRKSGQPPPTAYAPIEILIGSVDGVTR